MTTAGRTTKRRLPATKFGGTGHFVRLLALLVVGFSIGCQRHGLETAKVHGQVTLDGQPVKKGTVMFVPSAGRAGHGVIAPDGTFELTTYADGDGAVIGEHQISVFVPHDENASAEEMARNRLPIKYATTASSGLTWNIKSGQVNEVQLELKSH
jgi:hypothetical protein